MPREQISAGVMARAAEENPREFFAAMMNEGYRHTKKADWVITGVPEAFFNPVMRTDFPEAAGRDIRRMVTRFQSSESPMSWWVVPSTRPKDLADQLLANGFKFDQSVPVMSVKLQQLKQPDYPNGLVTRQVHDRKELTRWSKVMAESFEIPAKVLKPLLEIFLRKESSGDSDVVNYGGFLEGRLVATSTLFLGRSAAGMYNVATTARARGRGIGSAMTHFALSEALRRGFTIGTLQSSKLGYGLYLKMGFEENYWLRSYNRVD